MLRRCHAALVRGHEREAVAPREWQEHEERLGRQRRRDELDARDVLLGAQREDQSADPDTEESSREDEAEGDARTPEYR
jgi:hypothetical protein